jgi:site-specific DNA-methyltransferase (adenine-specific)
MSKIELINGDCLIELKNLKDNSVDMILTDPPYGMSFQSNYRKVKHKKIKNDDCLDWLEDFIKEIYRISKNNTAHYIFCSIHNIDIFKKEIQKMFKIKNILIWKKNNTGMGDLKGSFAPKYEFIIFFHKGRRLINGKRDCDILEFNKTGNKLHPTEKPVDLLEYLIEKFSDKNDLCIDPFMGSGSTGVAAKNLNRNFIGIELDEEYFNISKRRIK